MPKTPLAELAHQLAMFGGQNTLSEEEQFKLRYLELPRYEYGAQPLPVNVAGTRRNFDCIWKLNFNLLYKYVSRSWSRSIEGIAY
jgi:hypothetical protein